MLTPRQYEAVGRLALAFNEIEYVFEVYLAHLLGTPEWGVSVLFAEEGLFRQKAERFVRVLKVIREERPIIEAWLDGVLPLVERAQELSKRRNGYVHALIVENFDKNETRLRIRGREVACDEIEIKNVALQVEELVHKMHAAFGDLIAILGQVRESR